MGNNYQRLFYIFQNMDNNLGKPTGYIKVEINDLTAKLQISLNNLANKPEIRYQLYGMSNRENKLQYAEICDIEDNNGRADHKFNMESSNIGGSRLCFDDINVFAVMAKLPDAYNSSIFPLVAYRNGQVQWRQELEAALKKPAAPVSVEAAAEKMIERVDTAANTISPLDEYTPVWEQQQAIEEEAIPADIRADGENGNIPEEMAPPGEMNSFEEERADIITEEGLEREELEEETVGQLSDLIEVSVNYEDEDPPAAVTPEPENMEDKSRDDVSSKFESTLTSIYNREKGNEAINIESDIISAAEKNFRDISSINADGDRVRKELDIDLLKEELDKSFEICNPFNTRSKRFRWWKINSPGYLNNVLFRNNVKTYLLFNPKVMLAHYKYRYIVFGIRYDRYSGRERFVCGVPGVYSIDENPFGNLGSWAQLEGYRPKYGAFGYWIILIDPRTGKLIKIK